MCVGREERMFFFEGWVVRLYDMVYLMIAYRENIVIIIYKNFIKVKDWISENLRNFWNRVFRGWKVVFFYNF